MDHILYFQQSVEFTLITHWTALQSVCTSMVTLKTKLILSVYTRTNKSLWVYPERNNFYNLSLGQMATTIINPLPIHGM